MQCSHISENARQAADFDWSRLAQALVLIERKCSPYGPAVVPLANVAALLPTSCRAKEILLIINAPGIGPGGQHLVDRIRQLLAERGIVELGFGTTRVTGSAAALCPSEGWALLAQSEDAESIAAQLRQEITKIELEIYSAFTESTQRPAAVPVVSQVTASMPPVSIEAEFALPPMAAPWPPAIAPGTKPQMPASPVAATFKLDRHELLALATHWAACIVDIEYLWTIHGAACRSWAREQDDAHDRLNAVIDLGLLTKDQVDKIVQEERAKAGLQPPPEK